VTTFNLASNPWIPVLDVAGGRRLVGIRDALCDAHRIERISPVSPLAEVALHRLILAILHRALDGPSHTVKAVELYESGQLPRNRIEDYLNAWKHRFNLFDPRYPFFQVPDLPDDSPLPWTKLLPECASGHNPTLFDHTTDDNPPLVSPAEAAVALIVHQSFAPGGLIKRLGVTSGKAGPLASAAVFLPQGATLFETLLLNLTPYDGAGDEPIWERPPYRTRDVEGGRAQAMLSGRTRIYTWMSRAVRFLPEDSGTVRFIAYGPGVQPLEAPDLDPMCAYRRTDRGIRSYRLPQDRSFWRDFEAVLPGEPGWLAPGVLDHAREFLRQTGRMSLLFPLVVAGQLTDQAKVVDVRREVYPLSVRSMAPDAAGAIRRALERARSVGDALDRAARQLAGSLLFPGNARPPVEDIRRFVDSLPLHHVYWSVLERAFPEFLEHLTLRGPEPAMEIWMAATERAAYDAWKKAADAVGTTARHLRAIAEGERTFLHALGRSTV
jgi:CRISPR system Cascade subunit CasA